MPSFVGDALLAHANAGCYRCSRGNNLVDHDVQIVGEGALALCKGCIAEAAEAAGLVVNGARVRELEQQLQAAQAAIEVAGDREARFNRALQASAPLVVPAT